MKRINISRQSRSQPRLWVESPWDSHRQLDSTKIQGWCTAERDRRVTKYRDLCCCFVCQKKSFRGGTTALSKYRKQVSNDKLQRQWWQSTCRSSRQMQQISPRRETYSRKPPNPPPEEPTKAAWNHTEESCGKVPKYGGNERNNL